MNRNDSGNLGVCQSPATAVPACAFLGRFPGYIDGTNTSFAPPLRQTCSWDVKRLLFPPPRVLKQKDPQLPPPVRSWFGVRPVPGVLGPKLRRIHIPCSRDESLPFFTFCRRGKDHFLTVVFPHHCISAPGLLWQPADAPQRTC